MIESLSWDTNFFNFSVGKFSIRGKKINRETFIKMCHDFLLVYIYSDTKLTTFDGCEFMEEKVTFSKKITNTHSQNSKISEFNIKNDSMGELLNLVYLSGIHSRFKNDKKFVNNEFQKLYEKWISNCLNNKKDSKVLIYKENNAIIGFTTIESLNTNNSKIGLVAVNENFHRKGVAKALLLYAEHVALTNNCKLIEVTTQGQNKSAISFYQNYGFNVIFTNYIYHYWNSL